MRHELSVHLIGQGRRILLGALGIALVTAGLDVPARAAPRSVAEALRHLRRGSEGERLQAVFWLCRDPRARRPGVIKRVTKGLLRAAQREGHTEVGGVALTDRCAPMARKALVPKLLPLLRHRRAGTRSNALQLTVLRRDPRARPLLLRLLLKERDVSVRRRVAKALDTFHSGPDVVRACLRALKRDQDDWVRMSAVSALERAGKSAAVLAGLAAAVTQALSDLVEAQALGALSRLDLPHANRIALSLLQKAGDRLGRYLLRSVISTLARQRDPKAVIALKRMIWKTQRKEARYQAVWHIPLLLGRAEGQRFLIRLLKKHTLPLGRGVAAYRMGYLDAPTPAVLEALRAAARSDPDKTVRETAQQALKRLTSQRRPRPSR